LPNQSLTNYIQTTSEFSLRKALPRHIPEQYLIQILASFVQYSFSSRLQTLVVKMQVLNTDVENGDFWSLLDDDAFNLFSNYDYELPAMSADYFAIDNIGGTTSSKPSNAIGEPASGDTVFPLLDIHNSSSNMSSRELRLELESFSSGSQLEPSVTQSASPPHTHINFGPDDCGGTEETDIVAAAPPVKRKWDQSIVVFSASNPEKIIQKKRKAYTPSRRMEVALNRMVGACLQCRIRKGPVSRV
jgi:hypothetical protein